MKGLLYNTFALKTRKLDKSLVNYSTFIMFSLIAACDAKNGIGLNGGIPWKSPEDMAHFKKITEGHVVIMGRKTWYSLPKRPLPNRMNVLLSNTEMTISSVDMTFNSIEQCVEWFTDNKARFKGKKLFVIGGASIYNQFLSKDLVWDLHITHIFGNYDCDTFITFPKDLKSSWGHTQLSPTTRYRVYYTINKEENQFLSLMNDIVSHGNKKGDRTGTGTMSVFGRQLRFDLTEGRIPMMTTRPVSLRYVFEELMWILRGQTNNKILNDKKIHIWDDNTTREFLDSRGLTHLPEGDVGASYGFQMRHFGEEYKDCETKYGGFDQLDNVIKLLKNNPDSRRIVISLWNPAQLDKMALPPCLYGYQFYVSNGYLSCILTQRSSDIALAGSHNCIAGALLVHMLGAITGLKAGELIWNPADIHVYMNQIDAVDEQLKRHPKPFPTLRVVNVPKDIRDFKYSDFKLYNYAPHPKIKFAMNT